MKFAAKYGEATLIALLLAVFFDALVIAWSSTQRLDQNTIFTAIVYFVIAMVLIIASRLISRLLPMILFLLTDLLAIWIAGNLINQQIGAQPNQINFLSCVIPLFFFGMPLFSILKASVTRGAKKEEHKEEEKHEHAE